jgi:hypothetical protein
LQVADQKEEAQAFARRTASPGASASQPTSFRSLVEIGENAKAEPIWRLGTTIPRPAQAPAGELAALDQQRREIETALQHLKARMH